MSSFALLVHVFSFSHQTQSLPSEKEPTQLSQSVFSLQPAAREGSEMKHERGESTKEKKKRGEREKKTEKHGQKDEKA